MKTNAMNKGILMCIDRLFLIFSFCSLLFFSCNPRSETSLFLKDASRLAESHPDSALRLLDSILYPETSLDKTEYMQYMVRKVQLRYKTFYDISGDTLIFDATRYFLAEKKDLYYTVLAQFYSGCVRREQKNYESSMAYYKDAELNAHELKDSLLIGLVNYNIGDLFAERGLYGKALNKYKIASKYYLKHPEKQINCYNSIGRMLLFEDKTDSAFLYFHHGLDLARETDNDELYRQLSHSLGVAYENAQNYYKAEKYLRESLKLNKDTVELPRYYLNFAILYRKMGQVDSTNFYVEKLEGGLLTLKKKTLQASVLNFLASWKKAEGKNNEAYDLLNERMDVLTQIMEERMNQSVYDVEQKYNFEQLQKQYYRDLASRQKWVIVLLAIVIFGGVSFTIYWSVQRNKKIEIERNINTLREMTQDLETVVQRKQKDLRRELLWRFDVTKKVMKINEEIANETRNMSDKISIVEQFNKIVYGETTIDEQWEVLLQTFNNARPGYAQKIKEKYPTITEAEFRICILTYADFSIKEIALVLKQSPNTIQTRRTSLRHKIGLGAGGDIANYIDTVLT